MRIIKSRKKFIEELRVNDSLIYGKPYSKFELELDTYRVFIGDNLEGFINFMEMMNLILRQLEDDFIMSNVGFKARIKDAIGSVKCTGILDDAFGFELVTPHEIDKEILMLLMNSVFDPEICHREKKIDKSNGYNAYHTVGVVKKEINELSKEEIINYILNAKTRKVKEKYRDLSSEEKQKISMDELYEECDLYPALKDYIIMNGDLEENTYRTLKNLWKTISSYYNQKPDLRRRIPPIEIQFKTANIAEESIYGKSMHHYYKPLEEEDVVKKYRTKKLMKGMHFPFKFERKDGQMRLQPTNKTLIEMWPFLKDEILKFRQEHPQTLVSYDMHFASVFPELKPYVKQLGKSEPYISVRNSDANQVWRLLKLRIINPEFALKEYKQPSKKQKGEE